MGKRGRPVENQEYLLSIIKSFISYAENEIRRNRAQTAKKLFAPQAIQKFLKPYSSLSPEQIGHIKTRLRSLYRETNNSWPVRERKKITAKDAPGLPGGPAAVPVLARSARAGGGDAERSRPLTFQIGEAAVIAEKTGIPVVSDFRPQDIALGGEGAPLVPFFDDFFFGKGPVRAFQNIGGIGNVTLVGRSLKSPIAFDTGPGNALMDLAMQKITKGRLSCDISGRFAARGHVDSAKIRSLMKHPYFRKGPPKSTGREEFGEAFLKKYFDIKNRGQAQEGQSPVFCDILATLNYFTAFTIYEGIVRARYAVPLPKEIIISGGGALNLELMKNLKNLFSPVPVFTSEEIGIPVQAKEALVFAFLGLRAFERKINHLPKTTGACRAAILGKLTLPSKRSQAPFMR
jgi:anhydro-N-acetylmuramic acid kinase